MIKFLENDIINKGYFFEISRFGYQISNRDRSVTIDLFIYEKQGSIYHIQNEIERNNWYNDYFYEDELFPLLEVYLNNQRTKFAKEYKKYIIRSLGESSIKEGKVYNLHKVGFLEYMIYQFYKFFNYDYSE